jgi:hypothetical protein
MVGLFIRIIIYQFLFVVFGVDIEHLDKRKQVISKGGKGGHEKKLIGGTWCLFLVVSDVDEERGK